RYDALEPVGMRLAQERLAASDHVVAVAYRVVRDAADQRRETLLALVQRQGAQVRAVEGPQIEDDVAQGGPSWRRTERLLETLEARAPVGLEHDDLAVEPRRLHGQPGARPRHRPEAFAPVLPAAREEPCPSLLDPAERTVAVVLDLVQPRVAPGRLVGQDRELGHDARRQRLDGAPPAGPRPPREDVALRPAG